MAGSEIRRQISGMPTGRVALSWRCWRCAPLCGSNFITIRSGITFRSRRSGRVSACHTKCPRSSRTGMTASPSPGVSARRAVEGDRFVECHGRNRHPGAGCFPFYCHDAPANSASPQQSSERSAHRSNSSMAMSDVSPGQAARPRTDRRNWWPHG